MERLFIRDTKKQIYNTDEFLEKVNEFREIFPKGINRSTQKPHRSPIKELQKKLAKFFAENPDYSWDLVLDAADNYVERYSKVDYAMMRTSSYFISKIIGGEQSSDLAAECQLLVDEV